MEAVDIGVGLHDRRPDVSREGLAGNCEVGFRGPDLPRCEVGRVELAGVGYYSRITFPADPPDDLFRHRQKIADVLLRPAHNPGQFCRWNIAQFPNLDRHLHSTSP